VKLFTSEIFHNYLNSRELICRTEKLEFGHYVIKEWTCPKWMFIFWTLVGAASLFLSNIVVQLYFRACLP